MRLVGRLGPASVALLLASAAFGQPAPSAPAARPAVPSYAPPEDVSFRRTAIVSEGTRMAAEVFAPTAAAGQKLPCLLLAHGWGGVAALLRPEAVAFARAGYFVATFDYRGWGQSEGRLILAGPAPAERDAGGFLAQVKEVREVVDPIDMGTDWLNALHWLAAEPQCDADRIGLWGSSFSGGLVVYAAARDDRVKVLHSQVGALDGRRFLVGDELKTTRQEGSERARGTIGYPAPGLRVVGNLRGAPIRPRFVGYAPVDEVDRARGCAMQFVIAENEELFDNREHALKAYARAAGPKNLVTLPRITHYGVYQEARAEAQRLALAWFDAHLKSQSQGARR
jgi:uncharacterized protein